MTVQPLHLRAVVLPGEDERDLWVDADGLVRAEPVPGARTIATRGYVVPGLVDAHCHVGLDANGAVPPETQERQAVTDRDAGALLLRDAGTAADTRWIDDRDDLPRIVRAGRHIARSKRYIRNYGAEVEPEELVAEVETQARRGDGWVKLVGDWIDRDAGDLTPCWPAQAAAAAIARAHELGARVTAHCFGEQSVAELVAAGIDCIEHGTGLTDDVIAQMAARGTALVPTRVQLDNFPTYAEQAGAKFPQYADHMRDLHARCDATLRAAHEAGVPIYAGTDAGGVLPHGLIGREVLALHRQVGLPAADALGAASWRARAWLGHPGLEPGAPADLVLYDEDPLADLRALAHPARVVLRGRIVA
ncbi:MAG TPA: amidohydrolase family protein [Actinomycetes bacterium]